MERDGKYRREYKYLQCELRNQKNEKKTQQQTTTRVKKRKEERSAAMDSKNV